MRCRLIQGFAGREAEYRLRRVGDYLAKRVTVADIDARLLILGLRRKIVAEAGLR